MLLQEKEMCEGKSNIISWAVCHLLRNTVHVFSASYKDCRLRGSLKSKGDPTGKLAVAFTNLTVVLLPWHKGGRLLALGQDKYYNKSLINIGPFSWVQTLKDCPDCLYMSGRKVYDTCPRYEDVKKFILKHTMLYYIKIPKEWCSLQ
jgi:hypothetical protein